MATQKFFKPWPVTRRLMLAVAVSILIHALAFSLVPGFRPGRVKPPDILQVVLAPLRTPPARSAPPAEESPAKRPAKPSTLPRPRDKMPNPARVATPEPAADAPVSRADTAAAAPEPILSLPTEGQFPSAHLEALPPRPAVVEPMVSESEASAGYRESLSRVIGKYRRYPRAAQMRGWQGTARVAIYMGPGDMVERVTLAESSGYGLLDEEAVGMVRRAMPLPPPPSSLRGREFVVSVPIEFRLRN